MCFKEAASQETIRPVLPYFGEAAAKIRSNAEGQIESGASITSDIFTAGSAVSFAALTEGRLGSLSTMPLA